MHQKQKGSVFSLVFYVAGLYISFLTWSILQERINTKPYGVSEFTGSPIYFRAPLTVNLIQSFFAAIVGCVYYRVTNGGIPFDVFFQNDSKYSFKVFNAFLLISFSSTLSSPLGYHSLNHIDYLAYLLAKSCKLIPVIAIHKLVYGTKFPLFKYFVAGMVTLGVICFTTSNTKIKQSDLVDNKSTLGMLQLGSSMLLDGLTNSTQDYLFHLQPSNKNPKANFKTITGATIMCILNTFVFLLTALYCLLFKYEEECLYFINFVQSYPSSLRNILEFGLLGASGQIFVFLILERFDSLVLTTCTVTRKMFSMILSVVLFGHSLNIKQWVGIALVFCGICLESLPKILNRKVSIKKD